MARTYHHGKRGKKKLFGTWHRNSFPHAPAPPRKKRAVDDNWHWFRNDPGWWVREFMTKPQRARTRQLISKVMAMQDVEDAPLFPLAKKPYLYYR